MERAPAGVRVYVDQRYENAFIVCTKPPPDPDLVELTSLVSGQCLVSGSRIGVGGFTVQWEYFSASS